MSDPRPVVIHTGFQTAFRLRGVPKTAITPTGFVDGAGAALSELTQAKTTVKLTGSVENLPEACTCKARWVITTVAGGGRRVMIGEKLPLGVSGETFSLELTVDVFALQLFGKGVVSIEVQPDFPLCEPARLPDAKGLSFDNDATIEVVGGVSGLLVGAMRKLKPTTTGVLSDAEVRMILHESGDAADRAPRVYSWAGADRAEKPWLVGCAFEGVTLELDYQGPIEYGYTLEVRPAGGEWVGIARQQTFATAPRPKLVGLELIDKPGAGGTGYWWHQAFTFKGNERRDIAFVLTGKLENLSPQAVLPLHAALWVETGAETKWFRPGQAQASFLAKAGATFEVELADFTEMENHLDLTSTSAEWAFHAALASSLSGDRLLSEVVDLEGNVEPLGQGLAASQPGMAAAISVSLAGAVQAIQAGDPAVSCPVPAAQLEYHRKYDGSVRWRLTDRGIDVEGAGVERTEGSPDTVTRLWEEHHVAINHWAKDFKVPVELIMATLCTESGGDADSKREEPGWVSDDATPCRVSAGLMHTLISSARSVLKREAGLEDDLEEPVTCEYTNADGDTHEHGGPTYVTRSWLFEPYNSIMAGTAFISDQREETGFDPVLVACAYNAGSLRHNDHTGNRWRIAQYPSNSSKHADRFVKWFNDFWSVIANHTTRPSYSLRESFPKPDVRLSGPAWYDEYPTSRSIADLEASFRPKVEAFKAAMEAAATPANNLSISISATLRPKERAYLMHYCVKVMNEECTPSEANAACQGIGIDINWDHGDLAASKQAASEMKTKYDIAYPASLTSNHIVGKAIDWTITWVGSLNVAKKNETTTLDCTGSGSTSANLWAVGASYGVKKKTDDAPHWSHTGN